MKKGDKIIFRFHCAGVISEAEDVITKVTKTYIQIEGEPEYKFDIKTGKCLNEDSCFGCYRTVVLTHISTK